MEIYTDPQNSNNNDTFDFNQEFSSLIQEEGRSKSDIILAGDYSIDRLKVSERTAFNDFLNTIISNSFFQKLHFRPVLVIIMPL